MEKYVPGYVPENPEDIHRVINEELNRISDAFDPSKFNQGTFNIIDYYSSGDTDHTLAIQKAINAACVLGGRVYIPITDVNTYNYSTTLTVNSAGDYPVTITGDPGVTLHATSDTLQDIEVQSKYVTIENIKMTSDSTVRGVNFHNHRIVVNGITASAGYCTIRNIHIDGAKGAGVYNRRSDYFRAENCLIENTLADGINNFGSTNVSISDCLFDNTGDDACAFSGKTDDDLPSGQVSNCRSINSGAGGFTVWGGRGIQFTNCYAFDSEGASFRVQSATLSANEWHSCSHITFNNCTAIKAQFTTHPSRYGAFDIAASGTAHDTGTATAGSSGDVLEDTGASWNSGNLVGCLVQNTTDGSEGIVYENTDTTITAKLTGGTNNDWGTSDAYVIIPMASSIKIANCSSDYAYNEHVFIGGDGTYKNVRGVQVTDCTITGRSNTSFSSIRVLNSHDVAVCGNFIRDAEKSAIYIETNVEGSVRVTDNTIVGANRTATGGQDAIHCRPDGRVMITGNIVTDIDDNIDRSIQADGSSTDGLVQNNMVDWALQAVIEPDGAVNGLPTYTSTDIADSSHGVNTSINKRQGVMIWDSTNDKMKVATGAGDTDTWVDADGTNAVTPA